MRTPILVAAVLLCLPTPAALALETVSGEPPSDPEPWIAEFEGDSLDLRFGWDAARACHTDGVTTECFDTEAEMVASMAEEPGAASPEGAGFVGRGIRRASCASSLRLYSGSNFTGTVLAFTTRYVVLNLSNYGFNNVTSSYRVGGCSSFLYDLTGAGAPLYGGPSAPGSSASSMLPGWDNRVSSIYIG